MEYKCTMKDLKINMYLSTDFKKYKILKSALHPQNRLHQYFSSVIFNIKLSLLMNYVEY